MGKSRRAARAKAAQAGGAGRDDHSAPQRGVLAQALVGDALGRLRERERQEAACAGAGAPAKLVRFASEGPAEHRSQGAEIVALGYNTPSKNIHWNEPVHLRMFHHLLSLQAAAYQNAVWVAAAGKAGVEDGSHLIAGSAITRS